MHKHRRSKGGQDQQRSEASDTHQPAETASTTDSLVARQFSEYREELDSRHDKYERIVKLSRDVTVDSKRAIFLLHRFEGKENDPIAEEANEKLAMIRSGNLRRIALELGEGDPYRFLRAYSPGLQEYIEAVSYLHYLLHKQLIPLELVRQQLVFSVHEASETAAVAAAATCPPAPAAATDSVTTKPLASSDVTKASSIDSRSLEAVTARRDVTICVPVPVREYILGLADLTGELMRRAISCVGAGQLTAPFELRLFLQDMYNGFNALGGADKEVRRKMSTLKSSLSKVENACYTIQVRGSEIPEHMLSDVFTSASAEPLDSGADCQ